MRSKENHHPIVPSGAHATAASDGPRAFPILEAFRRIRVSSVKGYELIKTGELQSYLVGRRRYATAQALGAFVERRIAESKETAAQRARKVAKATEKSLV